MSSNVPTEVGLDSLQPHPAPVAAVEESTDSKLKTLFGILRRFIGVADIATVRFSLPSQLLEPIPNLEYWNYIDRPETFASIGDSEDELGRFLAVLRFWFTKDLKFVKGKPCKPYNSTLGEFFRCSWDVKETLPVLPTVSRPPTSTSVSDSNESNANSTGSIEGAVQTEGPVRVSFLTEQTSHHPPISAFVVECPEKGISARGYDQISAKFTGTAIRVTPGEHNLGIFITLHNRDEESYRLTHPSAHLGGFLKGSLSLYVQDMSIITCPKTKLKCILNYLSDSWIGKAKHRVEGVIYHYDHEDDDIDKIKDVPKEAIRAHIEGSWMSQVYYVFPDSTTKHLLIDLDPLFPATKSCPPEADMLPNESRKVWEGVTEAIMSKQYSKATQLKQEIEERQRVKAAERAARDEEWKPRFFVAPALAAGQPTLNGDGELVMKNMQLGKFSIPNTVG